VSKDPGKPKGTGAEAARVAMVTKPIAVAAALPKPDPRVAELEARIVELEAALRRLQR
jgi:hypothetical protein